MQQSLNQFLVILEGHEISICSDIRQGCAAWEECCAKRRRDRNYTAEIWISDRAEPWQLADTRDVPDEQWRR